MFVFTPIDWESALSLFASGCFPSGEVSQAKYIVHDVP